MKASRKLLIITIIGIVLPIVAAVHNSDIVRSTSEKNVSLICDATNYGEYTKDNLPYLYSEDGSYSTVNETRHSSNWSRLRISLNFKLITTKSGQLAKAPFRQLCVHIGAFSNGFSDKTSYFIALRQLLI